MKFENIKGTINLIGEFPKNMTAVQAIELVIEKVDFILQERIARRYVVDDGGGTTCAFCEFDDQQEDGGFYGDCKNCPIGIVYGSCFDTPYNELSCELNKDGQHKVSNIRKALKFLKEFAENYDPTTTK